MGSPRNEERVAVVTGGSRGIGRQVAARLAAAGHPVVIAYASNTDEADAAVAGIEADGGRALAVRTDIADETAVAALFARAEQAFGGVDVVVNAAGIMTLAPVAELDLADLDRILRTNVRGAFVVAQQAVAHLRSGGALINVSSTVTRLSMPTYAAYTASKAAVEGMTLVLARELRGRAVTVNAVAPGPTATALFLDGKDQAVIDRMAAQPPLARLGTPDDIAAVVEFLAAPGQWINGQVLFANGGIA